MEQDFFIGRHDAVAEAWGECTVSDNGCRTYRWLHNELTVETCGTTKHRLYRVYGTGAVGAAKAWQAQFLPKSFSR